MRSNERKAGLLGLAVAAVAWLACGGQVVFEPGGGEGAGGSGSSSATGSSKPAQSSTVASSTGAFSASTGPADPCVGAPCGAPCTVCNDFECLQGVCSAQGSCDPSAECDAHQACYVPEVGEACAGPLRAPYALCAGCGGGKGCSFFGQVVEGPFPGAAGECCYMVIGECVPNP